MTVAAHNRLPILSKYIDEKAREPFAYGTNDCLMVVAGAIEAITGVDHAAEYRGKYRSLSGARRLLGMSFLRFIGERLPSIHPAKAVDGDVAVLRHGKGWAFGIFVGAHVYAQAETGMGILPRSMAVKAFQV